MVWIMSIVGISALGILLDVLLPEGETNKYIKGVFAVFTVLVIISPLPSLIGSGFDLGKMLNGTSSSMLPDQSALSEIRRMQEEEREEVIARELSQAGFEDVGVIVTMEREKNDIKKVFLDFSNAVIDKETTHIDIKDKVNEYFIKRWNVKAERITIWNLMV